MIPAKPIKTVASAAFVPQAASASWIIHPSAPRMLIAALALSVVRWALAFLVAIHATSTSIARQDSFAVPRRFVSLEVKILASPTRSAEPAVLAAQQVSASPPVLLIVVPTQTVPLDSSADRLVRVSQMTMAAAPLIETARMDISVAHQRPVSLPLQMFVVRPGLARLDRCAVPLVSVFPTTLNFVIQTGSVAPAFSADHSVRVSQIPAAVAPSTRTALLDSFAGLLRSVFRVVSLHVGLEDKSAELAKSVALLVFVFRMALPYVPQTKTVTSASSAAPLESVSREVVTAALSKATARHVLNVAQPEPAFPKSKGLASRTQIVALAKCADRTVSAFRTPSAPRIATVASGSSAAHPACVSLKVLIRALQVATVALDVCAALSESAFQMARPCARRIRTAALARYVGRLVSVPRIPPTTAL